MSQCHNTSYEKKQNFNTLTRWLHSHRYKQILAVFAELAPRIPNRPMKVLEIGCASAKLFENLNSSFNIEYKGIDLNEEGIIAAQDRYSSLSNFQVILGNAVELLKQEKEVDIVVALETLEHIREPEVVRLVESIAALKPKLFICSVPVEIGPAIWIKNLGSFFMGYQRTKYTIAQTFWAGLYQLDKLPAHGVSHRGFNWFWLAQTIRYNFKILKLKKLPFNFVPSWLAPTVFFITAPRQ